VRPVARRLLHVAPVNDLTGILATCGLTAGLALCSACSPSPSPTSPAGGSASSAPTGATAKMPPGPKLVGALTTNAGDPWTAGGVVYLEDAPKQPGVALSAEIDVRNKVFTPNIGVVTTSGTVTFGNKDALTHHVFSPDIPAWDTGYLQKNDTASRRFDAPGAFALLCNIHPEMVGYVLVVPSTYFGRVGSDGKYVIPGLPSGTYRATAWVPRLPSVTQSVTIPSRGSTTANFVVPPAAPPQ